MERTGDTVTAHATTDPQVGSEVGAMSIKDSGNPILPAEEHELTS
jgi:hypothetical protein